MASARPVMDAERDFLERELDLRNCALDAAASHFMIVAMVEEAHRIVFVNRAFARDHGYAPEELLGKDARLLLSPDLSGPQQAQIDAAMHEGREVRSEVQVRRKDGSMFWAGIFLGPIRRSDGRITHYVGIGTDITARREQKRIEEALQERLLAEMQERMRISIELRLAQKLESVGRLAAGIAHEINTPIQYVGDSVTFLQSAFQDLEGLLRSYRASFARLAAGEAAHAVRGSIEEAEARADLKFLSVEVPQAFERTGEGVARVTAIVRAMKEFAHPDSNEQSHADINHAIETTLTVTHNEYKYLASIEKRFASLPSVLCNIGELNQVFLNLIVNAAHAIEAAGKGAADGRIEIVTELAGESVLISIADNGCGIPPDHLEKIFDPFFTTKEVGKGTGQGLAIARSIVIDKHGGKIDVHSTVGQGTRFTLTLPIAGRTARTAS